MIAERSHVPDPPRRPTAPLDRGARRIAGAAGSVPTVLGAGARLAGELGRVALGRSEVAPAEGDRRFADPTWTG